jgi:hypothetical protein
MKHPCAFPRAYYGVARVLVSRRSAKNREMFGRYRRDGVIAGRHHFGMSGSAGNVLLAPDIPERTTRLSGDERVQLPHHR